MNEEGIFLYNTYASIDPEIEQFRAMSKLPLMKEFKDFQIRSFKIGDVRLDISTPDSETGISLIYLRGNFKETRLKVHFEAKKETLVQTLQTALEVCHQLDLK